MRNEVTTTDGFILRTFDRGENDCSYHLFSREYGAIYVVALGVRKAESKLKDVLTVHSHVAITLVHGKNIRVKDAQNTTFPILDIYKSTGKTKIYFNILKTIVLLIRGTEKDEKLFDCLVEGCSILAKSDEKEIALVEMALINKILSFLGYIEVTSNLLEDDIKSLSDTQIFEATAKRVNKVMKGI